MFTETVEQAFLKDYLGKIRDKAKLEEQLITGQVLDHVEYAEHVGLLRGLRYSEELFLEVIRVYYPMK